MVSVPPSRAWNQPGDCKTFLRVKIMKKTNLPNSTFKINSPLLLLLRNLAALFVKNTIVFEHRFLISFHINNPLNFNSLQALLQLLWRLFKLVFLTDEQLLWTSNNNKSSQELPLQQRCMINLCINFFLIHWPNTVLSVN